MLPAEAAEAQVSSVALTQVGAPRGRGGRERNHLSSLRLPHLLPARGRGLPGVGVQGTPRATAADTSPSHRVEGSLVSSELRPPFGFGRNPVTAELLPLLCPLLLLPPARPNLLLPQGRPTFPLLGPKSAASKALTFPPGSQLGKPTPSLLPGFPNATQVTPLSPGKCLPL